MRWILRSPHIHRFQLPHTRHLAALQTARTLNGTSSLNHQHRLLRVCLRILHHAQPRLPQGRLLDFAHRPQFVRIFIEQRQIGASNQSQFGPLQKPGCLCSRPMVSRVRMPTALARRLRKDSPMGHVSYSAWKTSSTSGRRSTFAPSMASSWPTTLTPWQRCLQSAPTRFLACSQKKRPCPSSKPELVVLNSFLFCDRLQTCGHGSLCAVTERIAFLLLPYHQCEAPLRLFLQDAHVLRAMCPSPDRQQPCSCDEREACSDELSCLHRRVSRPRCNLLCWHLPNSSLHRSWRRVVA
jgi:hypothetical protein